MWAAARVRAATVHVQVRRADGRVEDLGVVSRYERASGRGLLATAQRWWSRGAEGWRALFAYAKAAPSGLLARAEAGPAALLARRAGRGDGVRAARLGWRAPAWLGSGRRRVGVGKER